MIHMLNLKIVWNFLHARKISDVFIDEADHIYIAMPLYNLIDHSDNYSDTSRSLWQFRRDEVPGNKVDLTVDNSPWLKYKTALVGKQQMLLAEIVL